MRLNTLILLSLFTHYVYAKDFYEILGIARDADNKEIRRAFKKLALKVHPDKNKDDPNAHENFMTINRAYEVLKDEELRKKYDLHGEEGLKENQFGGGRNYQSWHYFNEEFGIYDEDPEIITLGYSDFETSVVNSEDLWFINFYSPYCSHCHDLAPTWREVAKELEGVIRIGAVNCQEDWNLCNRQGIQNYPSLVLYPGGEFFRGDRSTDGIVNYMLENLDVILVDLHLDQFDAEIQASNLPWLVNFCDPTDEIHDCLSRETKIKVAAVLNNMVTIGSVDCSLEVDLCKQLGQSSGIAFYPSQQVTPEHASVVNEFHSQEVVQALLGLLPNLILIDEELFKTIDISVESWLIHFDKGETKNLEMRKLPSLLPEFQVGHVDCASYSSLCDSHHVYKYPSVGLFKKAGAYEWHHGRYTAKDIAVFAKEAASSKVFTLGPESFPEPVTSGDENWFVDFFAPWCPPCMRLLPEWRKASKQYYEMNKNVKFGTVDCTVHKDLCLKYNIRSYPSTVFYNRTFPHSFKGRHSASNLIEFIEDTLHPTSEILTAESFEALVSGKKKGQTWLVDFHAPWCSHCQQLASIWNKLAKKLKEEARVGSLDCQKYQDLCQKHGIQSYPTIKLYPHNSDGTQKSMHYQGWHNVESLYGWVFRYLPSIVIDLNPRDFDDKLLSAEGPWVVDFFAPWCGHCVQFAPHYEKLAKKLENKVTLAKVNCDQYHSTCVDAGVQAYPTIKFYTGTRNRLTQPTIGYHQFRTQDIDKMYEEIMNLVEEFDMKDEKHKKKGGKSKKEKKKKKKKKKESETNDIPPQHDEF